MADVYNSPLQLVRETKTSRVDDLVFKVASDLATLRGRVNDLTSFVIGLASLASLPVHRRSR